MTKYYQPRLMVHLNLANPQWIFRPQVDLSSILQHYTFSTSPWRPRAKFPDIIQNILLPILNKNDGGSVPALKKKTTCLFM